MEACEKAAISRRLLLWKLYFIFWHFSLLLSQAGHLDKRQKEKKTERERTSTDLLIQRMIPC